MKSLHDLEKHNKILRHLAQIPRKMLSVQGRENVASFVLYDLCHENGFNLHRAAYFVDNPDFNCFKGIAGVHKEEEHIHQNCCNIWESPDHYTNLVASSDFNKTIRDIEHQSIERNKLGAKDVIHSLATDLQFKNPIYYTWPMRHENKGYFIFDRVNGELDELDEHFNECIHLFSFCPIA